MNNFLERISYFTKMVNYPFNCLVYKIDKTIPKAFYDTIIDYLTENNPNYVDDPKISEFSIIITKNYKVYLEFIGNNNRDRIIVLDNFSYYSDLPPAKIIREYKFLNDVKHKDEIGNQKIISTLPDEFIKRFIKDEKERESIDQEFYKLSEKIIKYADYCVEERKKRIEQIYFEEAQSSTNSNKNKKAVNNTSTERVNKTIPFKEREKALDKYTFEYEFNAKSTNSNSIYIVKVYKTDNRKYKLIMEPLSGNKYTKIAHINSDNLSLEEVKKITIDTLQLSRDEISKRRNITRHSHTNLEEYKKLLEYITNRNNIGLNYSAKHSIDTSEAEIETHKIL